jgi:hypothetical protein
MEDQEEKLTKTERNFISRQRTYELQYQLSKMLYHSFYNARHFVDITAKYRPDKLAEAFPLAFEPYVRTMFVIMILEAGGRAITERLDEKWYGLEERDLFFACSPETQELLRQNFIFYEPKAKEEKLEEDLLLI